MLKLYGSTTSPYVRRLRIWLANTEHEFVNLQIFSEQDRQVLAAKNPTMKIPMLEDSSDDTTKVIFDSRIIYRYLTDKFDDPLLNWEQENQLTLIDAANDSLVQMFILTNSDIQPDEDKLFFKLQKERVNGVLVHLNEMVASQQFTSWNYPAVCLYCLIDWIEFRNLHNMQGLTDLLAFHDDNAQRIEVTATDPRK
ncbi:glutathione S-transferase family protein [Paraglaciecola sp. MB-3u-78]|uniref:glutathione S-transferase family protein n=1 Tax=Paraglaciecola sp. MB-3u-78 TaxID=2058332 RepID=UPI000C33181C|nr:glutathione S-transferase family protein [Paraglaciecola sp. MB-3u-78]PKH00141.1 glutathione S-transferase [Paraglaciecola sp. MB-3u-78]